MKVFNFSGFCCTLFFFFTIFFLALQTSNCATVVVDGVTHWNHPSANIGDTIIFKHKNQYNLYIFRTKEAFNTCNFTQATPLSNHNSTTYTPREKEGASPGPSYNDIGISPVPAASPAAMGSIPFINSNPAVPLPTGEVDSATIRPFPTSANQTSSQ
uniref:Phytocyanin domain-containing protein n=1 Tax=Chenopodium quinoa TaxID=63459 RepID=A0A803NE32_CHEQI